MRTMGRGLALWAFVVALVLTAGVAVDNSAAQVGTKVKEKAREKAREKEVEKETGELRFEVYTDKGGKFRWRLFAGSGHEIAMSVHGYTDEAEARSAIEAIRKGAARARIDEASTTKKK